MNREDLVPPPSSISLKKWIENEYIWHLEWAIAQNIGIDASTIFHFSKALNKKKIATMISEKYEVRRKPTVQDIIIAIENNYVEILERIWNEVNWKEVDPERKEDIYEAVWKSIKNGDICTMKTIIQLDENIDIEDIVIFAIKATKYGKIYTLKFIMDEYTIHPFNGGNYIFETAIKNGREKIVKLLLSDKFDHYNREDDIKHGIYIAVKHNQPTILRLLLNYKLLEIESKEEAFLFLRDGLKRKK